MLTNKNSAHGSHCYDEIELLRRVSNGDSDAFENLFNKYVHPLHNVAYNRLQSKEAADDLVQDVFAELWKNRSTLEIHTSLEAYLYQAVKHKVYKFIRHQSVRKKEEYIKRIRDKYYTRSLPDTDEMMEYCELKGLIKHQLDSFPEKTQNIYYLSRRESFTHRQIAEKLNCSPKTVEYHIGKVLQHLRIGLKDYIAILIPVVISLYGFIAWTFN